MEKGLDRVCFGGVLLFLRRLCPMPEKISRCFLFHASLADGRHQTPLLGHDSLGTYVVWKIWGESLENKQIVIDLRISIVATHDDC